MTGHRNFNELRGKMTAEQKKMSADLYRQQRMEMALADIRKMMGLTQKELAVALGISQPAVSEQEKKTDMEIGTLSRMIEGMGGELEINAVMPGGVVVRLMQLAKQTDPHPEVAQ